METVNEIGNEKGKLKRLNKSEGNEIECNTIKWITFIQTELYVDEGTNIRAVRTGNVLLRQDLGPENRTLLQTPVHGIIVIAVRKSVVRHFMVTI